MAHDDELISAGEATRILHVHRTTLARWADEGRIPVAQWTLGGHRRFRRGDVEKAREAVTQSRVLVWDYRQQPDLDELADAIESLSNGRVRLTVVDTGSDEYAIVLALRLLDPDEAYAAYAREDV